MLYSLKPGTQALLSSEVDNKKFLYLFETTPSDWLGKFYLGLATSTKILVGT